MKNVILSFLAILFAITIHAQQQTYSRVEVDLEKVSLKAMASLGLPLDAGFMKDKNHYVGEFSDKDLQKMEENGVPYHMLIADLQEYYVSRNETVSEEDIRQAAALSDVPVPEGFNLGSMGGFLTYEEVMAELDSMFQQYPELISEKQPVNDMTSIEGRPIYYVKISDNPNVDEDEPQVLYNSLTHAREPGGMMVLIFYMYHLLENYDSDPEIQQIVDNTELYFIPVVNPDGYLYNEETDPNGGGMWRKNRRDNGNGSFGVDLNRNYGYMWGYDNQGSSGNPWDATYRGTEPFSEPETAIIKEFCENHEFGIAINYHTYSNLWLYTWGYTEEPCEDDELLYAYAEQMTQVNNYEFGPGSTTIYATNGGSDDWMYGEQETKNKILSFTPEVGNSSDGFWPSSSRIIPHCQENLQANMLAAKFTGHYAVANDQEPAILEEEAGHLNFTVKRYGLADDTDYTVSIAPLSDNIVITGEPVVFQELELMENVADSIAFTLAENTPEGDTVAYILSLDDGFSVKQDTLYKIFGTPSAIFEDEITTLDDFINDGWGITDQDYTSAPYSITDSPGTDYYNNQYNTITIADTIDLTAASFALFRFNARWEIEAGYDYVQVQISDVEGSGWNALEGTFTSTGTSYQQEGEPLYDGFQTEWVTEEIPLNDYLGEKVLIRFVFESDMGVTEDGFYFDDLSVNIVEQVSTQMDAELIQKAQVKVYPNPAGEVLYIKPVGNVSPSHVVLYNLQGKETLRAGAGSHAISLKNVEPGIYFYTVHFNNRETERVNGKLIIR